MLKLWPLEQITGVLAGFTLGSHCWKIFATNLISSREYRLWYQFYGPDRAAWGSVKIRSLWAPNCVIFAWSILADTHSTHLIELLKCNMYTGCFRRTLPFFGRAFLVLNYASVTEHTFIRSLKRYGQNGEVNLREWELIQIYRLPNTYWNRRYL